MHLATVGDLALSTGRWETGSSNRVDGTLSKYSDEGRQIRLI